MRCRHCYVVADAGRPEIDTSSLRALLPALRRAGTLFLTFTGGEPLLRKDTRLLLAEANQAGFSVHLLTNGTLADEETIKWLTRLPLSYVGMSLYGAKAETHDSFTRVRGSFRRTVDAARRLSGDGLYAAFKYLIMKGNAAEITAAADFAHRIGIPIDYDFTIAPRDDGGHAPLRYRVATRQMRAVSEWFIRRYSGVSAGRSSESEGSDTDQRETRGTEGTGLGDSAAQTEDHCAAGRTMCSISAYGDVYPCLQVPLAAGNIRTTAFERIWRESRLLRRFRGRNWPDGGDTCRSCDMLKFCGRCPGIALLENGSMDAPSSEACRQAAVLAALSGARLGNGAD
jgi:radical SAM protein with 4Fe4S-binding SPASM domain